MTSSRLYAATFVLSVALIHCNRRQEPTVAEVVSDADPSFDALRRGERSFAMRCGTCHARESDAVGPSLREIASIHGDAPDGIVRWTRAPGRKRPNKTQMPSFEHLAEDDLRAIATYIIWAGRQDAGAR
jgi:mono/diheme cytochrome c family protein